VPPGVDEHRVVPRKANRDDGVAELVDEDEKRAEDAEAQRVRE
jgi:hypothetical protein